MQKTEDISGFIASLTGSDFYIFDYLVEEILAQQSTEIRTFLLYTSILDQFTPSLCDALLAADVEPSLSRPSAYILKELTDKNLFITPLDYERQWYRYHHLFSDLLKVILKQSNPDISFELHHRASAWYESQGMLSEALQHALDSGDMRSSRRSFLRMSLRCGIVMTLSLCFTRSILCY